MLLMSALSAFLHCSSGASESTTAAEVCSTHAVAVYESCTVFACRGVPWGVGVPDLCGGLIRSHPVKQVSGLEAHSRSPPAALHHVANPASCIKLQKIIIKTAMMEHFA